MLNDFWILSSTLHDEEETNMSSTFQIEHVLSCGAVSTVVYLLDRAAYHFLASLLLFHDNTCHISANSHAQNISLPQWGDISGSTVLMMFYLAWRGGASLKSLQD